MSYTRNTFTWLLMVFLATAAWSAADDKPKQAAPVESADPIPTGLLGKPIGTYLTIEGVRAEEGKVGVNTLLVDTLNGKKLERPVAVWIDNVELPGKARYILKGYESGKWIGTPPGVLKAIGGPGQQAAWQFSRYFVATSVEAPGSLKKN